MTVPVYRWWTCRCWHTGIERGLKLGPISVFQFRDEGRWWTGMTACCRIILYDAWIRAHRVKD